MPHLLLALGAALTLTPGDPQNPAGPPAAPASAALAPSAAPAPIDVVGALEATLTEAIARAEPSVVALARDRSERTDRTLAVRGRDPDRRALPERPAPPGLNPRGAFPGMAVPFEAEGPDYIASDFGSGVVIGPGNQILTAFSVVQGASRLKACSKLTGYFEVEIIAADPRTDLAVLVPRADSDRKLPNLPALPLGDATKLRKGSFVLALGNPFNVARDGLASASWGILANTARRLDSSNLDGDPSRKQLRHYPTLLQLDSKLNLGMTGGAVLNLRGELVGLTTDAANVGGFDAQSGYATPIDALARRAINLLREGREVEYGFLGVSLGTESSRISFVSPGTPAGENDFRQGDLIVSIGEYPIHDADSLILAVNAYSPGAPIVVKLQRDGEEIARSISLAKLPINGEVIATVRPEPWRGIRVDYLSLNANNPVFRNRVFGAIDPGAMGVIVVEVRPGSVGEDAELRPGQVINAVDGVPVRTPADFAQAVGKKRGAVTLTVDSHPVTIK